MDEMADVIDHDGYNEVEMVDSPGSTGLSTLDFFLTAEPEASVPRDVEVKRLGLIFTLHAIEDEAIRMCMKRSEKRQTKMEKQRGLTPERDTNLMEALIIVEACTGIKKRLVTTEEAKEKGQQEFADPIALTDSRLLDKWGPRPQDVIDRWLLPGERAQLADIATDLAGYETNAVVEAGN